MGAFVVFAWLRAHANGIFQARADYVVAWERALFWGAYPTSWLQERLYSFDSPSWFDWSMAFVHASYFLVPHAIALFVWAYHREHLGRFLVAMIGAYYAALAFQALVPTVPPWMAGMLDGHECVHRVVEEIASHRTPDTYQRIYAIAGANDVAAMPSLHMSITVLVALMLRRLKATWAWLGWGYAALMGFALVYLGEHYVVDTMAGAVLAVAVWRATRLLAPIGLAKAAETGVVRDRIPLQSGGGL